MCAYDIAISLPEFLPIQNSSDQVKVNNPIYIYIYREREICMDICILYIHKSSSLSLSIYIYIYTYIYTYTHICIHTYIDVRACMFQQGPRPPPGGGLRERPVGAAPEAVCYIIVYYIML